MVYPDLHVEQPNYAKMLTRMNGWVAENAARLNIAGIIQVGDITSHNMTIEWAHAPADAVVAWADAIVRRYPDHKVIYVTHCYLTRFGRPADYPTEGAVGSLANTGGGALGKAGEQTRQQLYGPERPRMARCADRSVSRGTRLCRPIRVRAVV